MRSLVRRLVVLWARLQVVPGAQSSVGRAKVRRQAQRVVQPRASHMRFCRRCFALRRQIHPIGNPSTAVSAKEATSQPGGNKGRGSAQRTERCRAPRQTEVHVLVGIEQFMSRRSQLLITRFQRSSTYLRMIRQPVSSSHIINPRYRYCSERCHGVHRPVFDIVVSVARRVINAAVKNGLKENSFQLEG
jgi:hypothetical protein